MRYLMTAATAGLVSSVAAITLYSAFRREMSAIRESLVAGSTIADTDSGPIEYARGGAGDPVLLIHGAGGGYDQGLSIGRGLLPQGFEIIAPSRFGYLRTPAPEDASPAAQADAHAALLDALGVEQAVVIGASAGAPSAIEFALRHPKRARALILLVPRAYAPGVEVSAADSAPNRAVMAMMLAAADFAYWLAIRLARSSLVRFLGVPPELEARAPRDERARVTAILRGVLPLSQRVHGIERDGEARIEEWPLSRIDCPTLVVSATDDLFNTLPGARFTAAHIPGAELVVLESGGHLMVGRSDEVRSAIERLLSRTSGEALPPRAPARAREMSLQTEAALDA